MFFFFFFDGISNGGSIVESNESNDSLFEDIKHINNDGSEFWYARELQKLLGYTEYRKFLPVINKAKEACQNSGYIVSDHFADVGEMVEIGSGATRFIENIKLTRYACYLIAMSGDSRKKVIAMAKTYFAIKTRQQEVMEDFNRLTDDEKRVSIRHNLKDHNKSLANAAKEAGVKNYAAFQNSGYSGLYGGLHAKDIHHHKGLKPNEHILDFMDYEELAANLFRATQTDAKLRRENIIGEKQANKTHFDVGKKVRETIQELGGTMPEDLPTPSESVKKVESRLKKQKKLENK